MKLNRDLDHEALREWRERVFRMAGLRCEYCGKAAAHAHHVLTRSIHAARYDVRNGCALCVACHSACHDRSPREFIEWFARHRPEDAAYLARTKNAIKIYT